MEEKNVFNVVVYTDGAAWPGSRGFYGAGVHGYMYRDSDLANKSRDRHSKHYITEDGYLEIEEVGKLECSHVNPFYYINGACSYHGEGTNNQGELLGMIETIDMLINSEHTIKSILIYSDSEYALGLLNKLKIDSNEVLMDINKPNRDLLVRFSGLVEYCSVNNIEIKNQYVKAHNTSLGNNLADRMAFLGRYNSARGKAEVNINITPSKNYWKPEVEKHPLVNFKQIFFMNKVRGVDSHYDYIIMDYKKDVELGKKSNTATFGLVLTKEPVNHIENVIDIFNKKLGSFSVLSSANTKEIYGQHNLTYHELFNNDIYTYSRKNNSLSVMEEDVVVNAIVPQGLANQAMTKTMALHQILNDYKEYKYKNDTNVGNYRTFIDITNTIYKIDDKGKTSTILGPTENMLNLTLNVNGTELYFPICLDTDTLSRNQFKKIEDLKTKVYLVVDRPHPKYAEYYMVVDTTANDDIGIYCNFYSNKVFIK